MINKDTKKRLYTSFFLILLFGLILNFTSVLIFTLLIFGVFSILEFLQISRKIFTNNIYKYITNLISILYISIFCYFFFVFSNTLQYKIIIYTFLLGCIASDIGGFLIGKLIKGPKLIKISPNKTYSGAIGSIIFTYFFISISFFIFTNEHNFFILTLSIIISISCQLGDLFFSFLKRKAKIKDTGNILPGHGGILDRIDGILFGVPIGIISLFLFY